MKNPAVYIMTNRANGTLYIGATGNLIRRVFQHKKGETEGFTKKYNLHSLVWCQMCETMESAILRGVSLRVWRSNLVVLVLVVGLPRRCASRNDGGKSRNREVVSQIRADY